MCQSRSERAGRLAETCSNHRNDGWTFNLTQRIDRSLSGASLTTFGNTDPFTSHQIKPYNYLLTGLRDLPPSPTCRVMQLFYYLLHFSSKYITRIVGEVADTEDNEGGGLSDSSAPPPPSSSDDSLARDLSTKLRISPAGTSALAVALPDEEWQAKSLSQEPIAVLSSPSSPSSVTDLERYLARFTAAERLCGSNQTTCEVCTKRSGGAKSIRRDSVKRDLIIRPPAVLTIHLKRFQQVRHHTVLFNRMQ